VEGEALGLAKVGPPVQGNMAIRGMYRGNTCTGEGEGRKWGLMDISQLWLPNREGE